MSVEVTANELVNFILGHRVKILELVKRRELLHVQSVGRNDIRFTLEEMLRFIARDFRDGSEDVREIRGSSFDAITANICQEKLDECQFTSTHR